MKIEAIGEVNKLWDSYNKLEKMRKIIYSSNCQMFKKRIGFNNREDWFKYFDTISFYSLDKTTEKELKAAMLDVIERRQAEIKKEIKEI